MFAQLAIAYSQCLICVVMFQLDSFRKSLLLQVHDFRPPIPKLTHDSLLSFVIYSGWSMKSFKKVKDWEKNRTISTKNLMSAKQRWPSKMKSSWLEDFYKRCIAVWKAKDSVHIDTCMILNNRIIRIQFWQAKNILITREKSKLCWLWPLLYVLALRFWQHFIWFRIHGRDIVHN